MLNIMWVQGCSTFELINTVDEELNYSGGLLLQGPHGATGETIVSRNLKPDTGSINAITQPLS